MVRNLNEVITDLIGADDFSFHRHQSFDRSMLLSADDTNLCEIFRDK